MKYYGKIQDPKDLVTKEYVDEADSNNAVYFGTASGRSFGNKFNVTIPGITELKQNTSIRVRFPGSLSGANPTLNVNGLGDIPIMYMAGTTPYASQHFGIGVILDLVYASGTWVIVGGAHAATNFYGVTKLSNNIEDNSSLALTPSALNDFAKYTISGYELYSDEATYEVGDRVRIGPYIVECTTAITTPEIYDPENWKILQPIVSMIENKYTKPDSGIPGTDLTDTVRTSLGKADTALQSVPATYRTAAAQDVIDQAQTAAINAKSTIEVWRLD